LDDFLANAEFCRETLYALGDAYNNYDLNFANKQWGPWYILQRKTTGPEPIIEIHTDGGIGILRSNGPGNYDWLDQLYAHQSAKVVGGSTAPILVRLDPGGIVIHYSKAADTCLDWRLSGIGIFDSFCPASKSWANSDFVQYTP